MFPWPSLCDVLGVDASDQDEVIRDLGRRIAELRASADLTQEQLAERLDLTPRYVQMIEAGEANPAIRALAELAHALGVGLADLFVPPTSREVRVGRPPKREKR
ncbi:MAG: helix-turn-helix transcriptional regulator [Polyangiaceae bacterium]